MKISELIKLGNNVLEILAQYIKDNNVTPPMRVYIRYFTTELKFSEAGCSSQGSSEIVQKPDWTMIVYKFMENKVKPLPDFVQLNQDIAKEYKKNINVIAPGCNEFSQAAFFLEMFLQKLIYTKLDGNIAPDFVLEAASLFKSELELSAKEYCYTYRLDGIILEAESIEINDKVTIRQIQKSDLERTRDIFLDSPTPTYIGIPPTMLEINLKVKEDIESFNYGSRLINCLRLYRLGSVCVREITTNRKTVIWPSGISRQWGNERYSSTYKYTVQKTEVSEFISFINSLEQNLNLDKEEKESRNINISLDRYNSALLESIDIDRKLMTAVMGLESLLTLEKDRGERMENLLNRYFYIKGLTKIVNKN